MYLMAAMNTPTWCLQKDAYMTGKYACKMDDVHVMLSVCIKNYCG
jgi:hypothetical protein